ncbi:hypothetical protein JCM10450v2_002066 [Rhodotorula kratochvilovae]
MASLDLHDTVESDDSASFSTLPPELALHILSFAVGAAPSPQALLARFVRVNRACHALATPLLYASPCVTSLTKLDALLEAVVHAERHGGEVRACRVEGKVFASKGWGVRINRVLKACRRIERLELVGIDDLRAKHLVGEGALTHLSLLNLSFSPNSLPSPPSLAPFLASLTHLTLANVGLPPPSTHMTDILALCAPHLEHLAISSLRDIDEREFRRALAVLVRRGAKLRSVKLGFLIEEQVRACCAPLLPDVETAAHLPTPPTSPTFPPFATRSSTPVPAPRSAPALSLLPALAHLTFTLPLPTLPLLLALPTSLTTLTLRPPYARPSSSSLAGNVQGTPTIFGTSFTSLLRVLDRGAPSPAVTPAPTPGAATPTRRRPSFTLEQLEEEERVLLALEEALGAPHEAAGGWVAPRLREVRWEGRAMRSARERVAEVLRRREAAAVGREEDGR